MKLFLVRDAIIAAQDENEAVEHYIEVAGGAVQEWEIVRPLKRLHPARDFLGRDDYSLLALPLQLIGDALDTMAPVVVARERA